MTSIIENLKNLCYNIEPGEIMVIIDKLSQDANINTLIFDIDGTITRWKNVKSFLEKSLTELGVPYTDDALQGMYKAMELREYHSIITAESDEDVYSALLGMCIPSLKEHNVTGRQLKDTMFELEASETFIEEDVPRELEQLAQDYKLYCYTNWFRNQALKKLDRYDLTKYFEAVHSSEDNYVKFSKVGFIYLIEKYHLNPQRTLHVGDSESDIVPSKNAGIHSIYLDYGIKTPDDLTEKKMKLMHKADATVTEFSDIQKVLTKRIR